MVELNLIAIEVKRWLQVVENRRIATRFGGIVDQILGMNRTHLALPGNDLLRNNSNRGRLGVRFV